VKDIAAANAYFATQSQARACSTWPTARKSPSTISAQRFAS
jgi:hypothetical protein